jgi:hypothetical protein
MPIIIMAGTEDRIVNFASQSEHLDGVLGQFRGRDGHCWPPPAQIRTCPIKASGSYLGCLTSKRASQLFVRGPTPGSHEPGSASGACFVGPRFPWSPALAPPTPPPVARLCSSASSLLCRSQTSLDRASAASAPHLPATDHPATTAPMADPEISRFPSKERPYMPGSKTTPGLAGARNDAPASVAFRGVNNVGTRVYNAFAAQWLAYTLPTDASQSSSRRTAHGSGATWVSGRGASYPTPPPQIPPCSFPAVGSRRRSNAIEG